MKIYSSRPPLNDPKDTVVETCLNWLDDLSVPYDAAVHEPAMTMEVCKDISQALDTHICKNLFLCNRQQTQYYLLMMPADKPFKTKHLSAQIGSSRLSFANEDAMMELLGITPGSVSVLGLLQDTQNRVQLVIDRDLLDQETLGIHPCLNSYTLKLSTHLLTQTILPALNHTPHLVDLPDERETAEPISPSR